MTYIKYYYYTLNSSRFTYTAPGFWMVKHQLVSNVIWPDILGGSSKIIIVWFTIVSVCVCVCVCVCSYQLTLLKPSTKALGQASKVCIRTDARGFLSLQYMIRLEEGQICFVEYLVSLLTCGLFVNHKCYWF